MHQSNRKNLSTRDTFTLLSSLIYEALDQGDKCLAIYLLILPDRLTPFLMTNKVVKCTELNFPNDEVEKDVSRFPNYLSELLHVSMCHSFICFDFKLLEKASFELLNVLLQCDACKSLSTPMVPKYLNLTGQSQIGHLEKLGIAIKNGGQKGLTRLTFSKYCTLHWVYRKVYFILDNYNYIILLNEKCINIKQFNL
ncbi:hypothetical protein AGLY_012495 [Aphis glycines]|uniref:Uncharacterized protein n=1 Tax=Aphis glycines TaxID=307491 RepID=A0A6G0T8U5_APHGL|nr:hypothetical protein AGLY_012495 [Aphis glycines]